MIHQSIKLLTEFHNKLSCIHIIILSWFAKKLVDFFKFLSKYWVVQKVISVFPNKKFSCTFSQFLNFTIKLQHHYIFLQLFKQGLIVFDSKQSFLFAKYGKLKVTFSVYFSFFFYQIGENAFQVRKQNFSLFMEMMP